MGKGAMAVRMAPAVAAAGIKTARESSTNEGDDTATRVYTDTPRNAENATKNLFFGVAQNLADGTTELHKRRSSTFGDLASHPPKYDYESVSGLDLNSEDIDSRPPTFVVYTIQQRGQTIDVRVSIHKSLYVFGLHNPIRQFCIHYVVLNVYFDYFIIISIIVNCIFLAMNNPPEESEYIFTAIFSFELVTKVIGLGFVAHEHSYLRDHWNKLDAGVVFLGYIALLPGAENYSAVRAFRVFRALKAITAIPDLRIMVLSLGRCLAAMGDIIVLILCTVIMFAIFALHLYMGVLRQKCVITPEEWPAADLHNYYHDWIGNSSHYLIDEGYQHCGNVSGAMHCPSDWTVDGTTYNVECLDAGPNPNYGYTNFDNFAMSSLMVFQLITIDYWENIYDRVLMATGPQSFFFFLLVISLGAFLIINLVLAVVATNYEEARPERATKVKKRRSQLPGAAVAESEPTAFNRFQDKLLKVVDSDVFNGLIVLLIVGNTITMSIEHPGMSDTLADTLNICNYFFTGCFVLEMFLKWTAYGLEGYFVGSKEKKYRSSPQWNRFDALVVLVSLIEICLEQLADTAGIGGLSILRTFRLLRVLKLGQSWKTMNKLINTIGHSISNLGHLTLVLSIIMYTFAVLGMQLYGEQYERHKDRFEDGEVPRWNFTDFGHSFLIIFRILCGEWVEPLWDTMLVAGPSAIVFYLMVLLVGNFVVLNLFLALLLSAFSHTDEKEEAKIAAKKLRARRKSSMESSVGSTSDLVTGRAPLPKRSSSTNSINITTNTSRVGPAATSTNSLNTVGEGGQVVGDLEGGRTSHQEVYNIQKVTDLCLCSPSLEMAVTPIRRQAYRLVQNPRFEAFIFIMIAWSSFMLVFEDKNLRDDTSLQETLLVMNIIFATVFSIELGLKIVAFGYRGYFSSGWNCLDCFIVIVSIVALAVATGGSGVKPLAAMRTLRALRPLRAVRRWEGMRIVVNALLTSIPSIMNVLVVCMLFWLIFSIVGVQFFGGMFSFCAVRDSFGPAQWEPYPATLHECVRVPSDGGYTSDAHYTGWVFNESNWVSPGTHCSNSSTSTFTSAGLLNNSDCSQLQSGGYNVSCIDVGTVNKQTCCALAATAGDLVSGGLSMCNAANNITGKFYWRTSVINFDHVGNAFMALYQVATFEGWMEVMEDAVDAVGVDQQPKREHQFHAYFFFVVFIIVGSFFTLNLFIGVIIDNFNYLKKHYEEQGQTGGLFLTDAQKKYVKVAKSMLRQKPSKVIPPPENWFRKLCFDFATSTRVETVVLGVIMFNTLVFCIHHYDMNEDLEHAVLILNILFTIVYVTEAIIKIIGLGHHYFKSGWNKFDFTIALFSVVGLILEHFRNQLAFDPAIGRVFRTLRIARLMRTIKYAQSLKTLLVALLMSAPALLNIGTLLFLVMFIYSVVGMNLFKDVMHNGALNEFVNFETFGRSFLLLFRLATSAGWNDITDACSIQPPDCDPDYRGYTNGNCGDATSAHLFFSSFIVVSFLIVINMYIAVILGNLFEAKNSDEVFVSSESFDDFYHYWQKFDPLATQMIDYPDIKDFLSEVPRPLGFPEGCTDSNVGDLNIPLYVDDKAGATHPKAHCADVLDALVQHLYGAYAAADVPDDDTDDSCELRALMKRKLALKFPKRTEIGVPNSTTLEYHQSTEAAKKIQRAWRALVTSRPMDTLIFDRERAKAQIGKRRSPSNSNMV